MARIIIDIPDEDLRLLDTLRKIKKVPRAKIIRLAITGYLKNNRINDNEHAFGLWQEKNEDGLAFQESLRKEWP